MFYFPKAIPDRDRFPSFNDDGKRPSTLFYFDIEIDREHWTVRQCYTKCNQNPEEKINAFAKFICDKAKAIYRKAA